MKKETLELFSELKVSLSSSEKGNIASEWSEITKKRKRSLQEESVDDKGKEEKENNTNGERAHEMENGEEDNEEIESFNTQHAFSSNTLTSEGTSKLLSWISELISQKSQN